MTGRGRPASARDGRALRGLPGQLCWRGSFAPTPIDARMIADQRHMVDVQVKKAVSPARDDAAFRFDSSFNLCETYNPLDARPIDV